MDKNQTAATAIVDSALYSEKDASAYLGKEPPTLRNARSTGVLSGIEAPGFLKIGSSVRYKGSTLRLWLEQFPERTCTKVA